MKPGRNPRSLSSDQRLPLLPGSVPPPLIHSLSPDSFNPQHCVAPRRRPASPPVQLQSPNSTAPSSGCSVAGGGASSVWGPSPALVIALVALLDLGLATYIVSPQLYWYAVEALTATATCPTCDCNCDARPLLDLPEALWLHHSGTFILFIAGFLCFSSDFICVGTRQTLRSPPPLPHTRHAESGRCSDIRCNRSPISPPAVRGACNRLIVAPSYTASSISSKQHCFQVVRLIAINRD